MALLRPLSWFGKPRDHMGKAVWETDRGATRRFSAAFRAATIFRWSISVDIDGTPTLAPSCPSNMSAESPTKETGGDLDVVRFAVVRLTY